MHIAMVLRQFSPHGGLELYAFQLVKGLLEKGHRVTVVCAADDTEFRHEKLNIVFFATTGKRLSKAEKIEHYYREASRAVADAGPFDIVHSQHLPIERADVVTFHNHTIYRLSEVGLPWEHTLNSFKLKFSKAYKLRDKYDAEMCHRSRCLIFPAQICADDFIKHYDCSGKAIAIAHPGANLSTQNVPLAKTSIGEDSTASAQDTNDSFNFLFVGKGYRKKGVDILLAACKLLKSKSPDFKLYIAGLRAKPLDSAKLMIQGLTENVHYLGFQRDMEAVYSRAQSTILPSRIEPFGMAPVQGMLHGLVPIVSAVSGVAEVLSDGKDALILKNHLDAEELSALMLRLMTDRKLYAQLSEAAVRTALTLTWDETVKATIAAYEQTKATIL